MAVSDVCVEFGPDGLRRIGAFRYAICVVKNGTHDIRLDRAERALIEAEVRPSERRCIWLPDRGVFHE